MTLEELNRLPAPRAERELLRCCGSLRWARRMARGRPFQSKSQLLDRAARTWQALQPEDWREAFSQHPRIGDLESVRVRFARTASWSAEEQSEARGASEETLRRLAEYNRLYEERFGFIFIVCATGKSAEHMEVMLRQRLENDPETELGIAAGEQQKIAALRLERLLS